MRISAVVSRVIFAAVPAMRKSLPQSRLLLRLWEENKMAEFSVIGQRVPRVDAREKVTGEAKYSADYSLPGMLWCKLLRSPFPHARILHIDTRQAAQLAGVKAIITGKD